MDAYDRAILRGTVAQLETERKQLRARIAESERESDARLRALIIMAAEDVLAVDPCGDLHSLSPDGVRRLVADVLREAGAAELEEE